MNPRSLPPTARCLCAALCLFLGVTLDAQLANADDLAPLFPMRAEIETAPVLARLPLSEEVLSEVRPDLSDIRIIDAAGQAIPFVIDDGAPRLRSPAVRSVEIRSAQRDRRDRLRHLERFTLAVPPAAQGAPQHLRIETVQRDFVANISVGSTSGDSIAEGTIFRFAPTRFGVVDHVEIPLPDGLPNEVVITIASETTYLEPRFVMRERVPSPTADRMSIPLEILSERTEEHASILVVRRPRGIVPSRLTLATSSEVFHRRVRVRDLGSLTAGQRDEAGRELADDSVHRVTAPFASDDLSVSIQRASGDRLEIRIDNEDSPALSGLRVAAIINRPSLLFQASDGSNTLYFGGGRAHAPRYDLESLNLMSSSGNADRLAAIPIATMDAPVANPDFDASPALSFAMRAGADVDPREFPHQRDLVLGEATEGLHRVRLDVAAMNAAHHLRVIDGDNKQWPFLMDRAVAEERVDLEVESTQRDDVTVYTLRYPASVEAATPLRIELQSDARLIARQYEVYELASAEEREESGQASTRGRYLADGTLTRDPGEREPLTIVSEVGRIAGGVELHVNNGDEAPLRLEAVAVVSLSDMYLVAPAGAYRVLYGGATGSTPTYEIERARDLVLSVPAEPATLGPRVANGDFTPPTAYGKRGQDLLLFGTLLATILLLGFVSLRMANTEVPPAPASDETKPDEVAAETRDDADVTTASASSGETAAAQDTSEGPGRGETEDPEADS